MWGCGDVGMCGCANIYELERLLKLKPNHTFIKNKALRFFQLPNIHYFCYIYFYQ